MSRGTHSFGWALSVALSIASVAFVIFIVCGGAARAHTAASGWEYPLYCCAGRDCREVSANAIGERPEGYVIKRTGEVLAYGDARLKGSPDGEYHWCSIAGAEDSRTVCLFVPTRSY